MMTLFVALSFSLMIVAADGTTESSEERRAKGVEARADRTFAGRNFQKAMSIYESAFKYRVNADYGASLHLKVGAHYLALSDYMNAASHYESAMSLSDQAFGVDDVCNYLDALRLSGQRMKAIAVSRKFACHEVCASDPRYLNRIRVLQSEEGYMPVGAAEYDFNPIAKIDGDESAFWIGVKGDEYFYAVSSTIHRDPFRRFYPKTDYYALASQSKFSMANSRFKKYNYLSMVPPNLKNGPVSFSQNAKKVIVTEVSFGKNIFGKRGGPVLAGFQSKLLFSDFDERKNKWTSFREALPQQPEYSYSHPYIFNDNQSLLFSSNMPGGFGGYDIYVARWDEEARAWREPVNLGPLVNTPGDEISPSVYNDMLVFASNGHVGFGGYDIYGINYNQGQAIAGSLTHYDYPINSVSNEFSLLHVNGDSGFVVSDRDQDKKDNIYFFERNKSALLGLIFDTQLTGMSEIRAISSGSIDLLARRDQVAAPINEPLPSNPVQEQMLSLFFDFDSYDLGEDALEDLKIWRDMVDFSRIEKLCVEGFADEIGEKDYNLYLSGQRAQKVCAWFQDNGLSIPMEAFAKGQIAVKVQAPDRHIHPQFGEKNNYNFKTILANKIWNTREARRVDIKVITK
jgi:outer membrane protein OmpA-like peptidoglycan-associated protein/tetratricopeptide (TPR) repeat protein